MPTPVNNKIPKDLREDKRKLFFVLMMNFCEEFPDYSAGDIMYAALRKVGKKNGQNMNFFLRTEDEDLVAYADEALKKEKEAKDE